MDDLFRFGDQFGPAKIVHIHRPSANLRAIVVVDYTACGVAIGGVRMAPDVSVEECFRLARAMTWKNAAAGLPHGGGKSVIFGDPRIPREHRFNSEMQQAGINGMAERAVERRAGSRACRRRRWERSEHP